MRGFRIRAAAALSGLGTPAPPTIFFKCDLDSRPPPRRRGHGSGEGPRPTSCCPLWAEEGVRVTHKPLGRMGGGCSRGVVAELAEAVKLF